MQLFYAPDIVPPLHTLSEEESKHCIRVLRLQRGGRIHITDGRGNLFCCEITDDNPRRCTVRVISAEACFEKLPYAFFKVGQTYGAEVGVTAVVPLETEHSERRVFKPERGEKVVTAALKQSLKAYRPVLHPLTPFRQAVLSAPEGRKFIAHCAPAQSSAGKAYLARTLRPGETATVFIGPEGDFSPGEIAFALASGFEEITLGQQRLRTETAALAAVVMAAVVNG